MAYDPKPKDLLTLITMLVKDVGDASMGSWFAHLWLDLPGLANAGKEARGKDHHEDEEALSSHVIGGQDEKAKTFSDNGFLE